MASRELECQIVNETGIAELVPVNVCEQNGSPHPHTTKRCNHDISCQGRHLIIFQMRKFHRCSYVPARPTSSLIYKICKTILILFIRIFHLDKALNYDFVGCFYDSRSLHSRLLPEILENLRSKIDWHNPSATIDECAILASERGKEYFAIQYYGECRSYRNENRLNYTALGISHKSWAGLGGPWTNCVYQFV